MNKIEITIFARVITFESLQSEISSPQTLKRLVKHVHTVAGPAFLPHAGFALTWLCAFLHVHKPANRSFPHRAGYLTVREQILGAPALQILTFNLSSKIQRLSRTNAAFSSDSGRKERYCLTMCTNSDLR